MNNQWQHISKNLALLFLTLALIFLPLSKMICHTAIILYVTLWFAEGNWRSKLTAFKNNLIPQILFAWMLLTALSLLASDNFSASLFSMEKKIFFFMMPICIATSSFKLSEKELRLIFYSFTAVCFGLIIYSATQSLLQWEAYNNDALAFERIDFLNSSGYFASHPEVSKSWVFFTYIGLANGADLHPSYFSLYVAFCIVFLLTEHSRAIAFRFQRECNIFLIVFFLITLVLLSSRIIVIGMVAIFMSIAVYETWAGQSRKRIIFTCAILFGFVAGILLNPISRHRGLRELSDMSYTVAEDTQYRTSAEIRASLWWLAWKSFQTVNPYFGAGGGNVETIMKEQGTRYNISNVLGTYDPHNQFLYALIAEGIIGLSMLLSILLVGVVAAIREKNVLLFAFLFLFTLMCITESALELQKGIVFFSLIFSLLSFQSYAANSTVSTSTSFANARN
jgi:O-antigen ligase